jgi:hypothetical protein
MPILPLIPEAVREKLTRERLAEAGVIAATVAMIMILGTALQLGLERYVIAGL